MSTDKGRDKATSGGCGGGTEGADVGLTMGAFIPGDRVSPLFTTWGDGVVVSFARAAEISPENIAMATVRGDPRQFVWVLHDKGHRLGGWYPTSLVDASNPSATGPLPSTEPLAEGPISQGGDAQ